jgi:Na+/proline symporter
MTTIVIISILISLVIYLCIGFFYKKSIHRVSDIIPVIKNTTASVENSKEFSASTVATTISLATVIVAFFELVPALGWWLLWPVITTVLGLWFFSKFVKRIWERMSRYDNRPSLHEFLGVEFSSKKLAFIGSLFTVIGYLTAFAVELTVGSRFLASLIPSIPQWITVLVITSVAFIYVSLGGFKATVATDRVQMIFIWLLLFALLVFYGVYILTNGTTVSFSSIPDNLKTISWDNSLLAFVLGILFMNLFTYVSNMGLWQRIAGSNEPKTVVNGMWSSVQQTALSWGLFVVVAIGAFMIVSPVENENLLITLIKGIEGSFIGKITIFTIVLGLYGAMLSTASTQLIAVSHTIYEDILAPFRKIALRDRISSKKELSLSRRVLLISAIASIGVVEILRVGGFSVADLAFAIYGAALGMTPAIILSLLWSRERLKYLSSFAYISIILGFSFGWGSAILGKVFDDGNLVFLSPLVGFGTAAIVLFIGWTINKNRSIPKV